MTIHRPNADLTLTLTLSNLPSACVCHWWHQPLSHSIQKSASCPEVFSPCVPHYPVDGRCQQDREPQKERSLFSIFQSLFSVFPPFSLPLKWQTWVSIVSLLNRAHTSVNSLFFNFSTLKTPREMFSWQTLIWSLLPIRFWIFTSDFRWSFYVQTTFFTLLFGKLSFLKTWFMTVCIVGEHSLMTNIWHTYYVNNISVSKSVQESESESEVAQSCLTLCDPVDCSPPGSSVHGILQARILEWVAI